MKRGNQTKPRPPARRARAGRMQFIRDQARKQQSAKQAAAQLEFLELGRGKGGASNGG